MAKWQLLLISALLYSIPFVVSASLSFMLFFCLAPFFYVALTSKISFKEGIFWGSILWGVQLIGILVLLFEHAEISVVGSLALWLILLLYLSAYTGFGFLIAGFLQRKLILCGLRALALWVFLLAVHFIWIEHGVLWIFDNFEGYFFAYPLLPLIEYPALLAYMPLLSKEFFLSALLIGNAMIAYMIARGLNRFALAILALSLLPFIAGFFKAQNVRLPSWLNTIGVLAPSVWKHHEYAWDRAHYLQEQLKPLLERNPDITSIIMPESSFKFPLNRLDAVSEFWNTYALNNRIRLIIGGYRYDADQLYNSLYCLYQGATVTVYDKKHGLPFFERLPCFMCSSLFKKLFLSRQVPFCQSAACRVLIPITDQQLCVPYICSDLFFYSHQKLSNYPALVVTNDAWFSCKYLQNLMLLVARFKALYCGQDMLYVSHTKSYFIHKTAALAALKNL